MFSKHFSAFFCLTALIGCATLKVPDRAPETYLTGTWDNSAQMAAAPAALKRPPIAGGTYDWIDAQHACFFPVDVPALTADGSTAIYLVWRSGGVEGPVSRQRLWVFRTSVAGARIMDFYAFKNPLPFEPIMSDTGVFKAITYDDLISYGPQCSLPISPQAQGWRASIPSTCAITARSGRKMMLSAEIVVDGDNLTYSEQGTLESGALAFKVPSGVPYRFVRTGK